jgi:hypothetical protein
VERGRTLKVKSFIIFVITLLHVCDSIFDVNPVIYLVHNRNIPRLLFHVV